MGEPLEDRTMLSAVTWNIVQAQSYLSMAIPDQSVDLDGTTVTVRVRNQSGGNSGPWNVGNTAAISGTLSTNYVDGASIEFLAGQPNLVGVNSGSYRPNPADFDPTAIDADNPNGSFTGTSSAPAVFGARVRASVSIFTVDAAFIAFYNTDYELSSSALAIAGSSFPANTLNVGIVRSDLAIDGLSVVLIGQKVADTLTTVDDMTATNSAATGTITNLGGQNRQLTIPIQLNLSIPIDDDPTHNLTATGTGQLVATADVTQPGTIHGQKFNDLNGNGSLDSGEPGLAGWTIQLDTGADGSVDATATTDASGNYSFTGLAPGTYRVREVPQTGWTQTTANPADATVTSGDNVTANFGNFQKITIAGQKFNDRNGNGSLDAGEPGLAGWTIQLDNGANGSVDATTTTDASGNYSFTGLGPGTYRVREVQQTGWTQTTANPADVTPTSGTNSTASFGNFQKITIGGRKFNDLNGNGALDAGESGLAGWTIQLDTGADGSVDATATTDASGNYSFTSLGPGTYRVREVQQTGWTQTTANPADVTATSGANVTANFGNFQRAIIHGQKFNDRNGNGMLDAGETGLPGWTIQLDSGADGSVDATATTDASGNYSFTSLAPGTYRVREVQQTGWVQTTTNPADATVTSGDNVTANFGNFQRITIGGQKFNDRNGNGSLDAGETGLPGWTIQLDTGADGSVDATATTDASGNYSFTSLGPGTYRVREVQQTGWMQTTANPADVTVTSGNNVTANFGNFQRITISGQKFNDRNGNGALDAGESGLPGWTIQLDRGADGSVDASATTDASGNYSFASLGPGTYRMREVQQTGWTRTTADPADIAVQSGIAVTGVNFGGLAIDFGDAPDPGYPTLLASNGARHGVSTIFLGSLIDAETEGQPNATATGDDANPSATNDEDGVVFNAPLVVGQSATLTVTATGPATGMYLSAWLDFAADGTWGPEDQIFVAQALNAGPNVLCFLVPATATAGTTYARFRLHTNPDGIPTTGFLPSGEVEDYRLHVSNNLDADGNGPVDALTDGILILRYLFDPSGAWNYSDALGSGATRTTRTEIKSYLDGGRTTALDVDGNGAPDALTDGILLLRYLFDPAGAWNYSDVLGIGATRTTRQQIKTFLDHCTSDQSSLADLPAAELAEEPALPPVDSSAAECETGNAATSTSVVLTCEAFAAASESDWTPEQRSQPSAPVVAGEGVDSVATVGQEPSAIAAIDTLPIRISEDLTPLTTGRVDNSASACPTAIGTADPKPLDSVLQQWKQPELCEGGAAWLGRPATSRSWQDDAGTVDPLWGDSDLDWFLDEPGVLKPLRA
jgi:protocatechuate 3,4-dioxygenase beta subunit